MLYSSVKIGYNKQEYKTINSRLEFNGQFDYTVDKPVNKQELNLISPYRTDSIGFEIKYVEYRYKNTNRTTDTEKDVYVVNIKRKGGNYITVMYDFIKGENNGQFNWKYNPRNLMLLNSDILASSGKFIRFTASTANTGYKTSEYEIVDDIEVDESTQIISPVIYDFAAGHLKKLPESNSRNGLVSFQYRGKTLQGFIKNISKHPAMEAESQYQLYKKYDGWEMPSSLELFLAYKDYVADWNSEECAIGIAVYGNIDNKWDVRIPDVDWCNLNESKTDNKSMLCLNLSKNINSVERTIDIEVFPKADKYKVEILKLKQLQANPTMLIEKSDFLIPYTENYFIVKPYFIALYPAQGVRFDSLPDWLKAYYINNTDVRLFAYQNNGESRETNLVLRSIDNPDLFVDVFVKQAAFNDTTVQPEIKIQAWKNGELTDIHEIILPTGGTNLTSIWTSIPSDNTDHIDHVEGAESWVDLVDVYGIGFEWHLKVGFNMNINGMRQNTVEFHSVNGKVGYLTIKQFGIDF